MGGKTAQAHMGAMFRAADIDGSGSISVGELCRTVFSTATRAQREEILAFISYKGPAAVSGELAIADRPLSNATVKSVRQ